MSERMCHTMQGVREASSFVPEIGTADTSDERKADELCYMVTHEQEP